MYVKMNEYRCLVPKSPVVNIITITSKAITIDYNRRGIYPSGQMGMGRTGEECDHLWSNRGTHIARSSVFGASPRRLILPLLE